MFFGIGSVVVFIVVMSFVFWVWLRIVNMCVGLDYYVAVLLLFVVCGI